MNIFEAYCVAEHTYKGTGFDDILVLKRTENWENLPGIKDVVFERDDNSYELKLLNVDPTITVEDLLATDWQAYVGIACEDEEDGYRYQRCV